MARRLIQQIVSPVAPVVVKVYRDPTENEYQCELFVDAQRSDRATYYTPDKDDAMSTARMVFDRAVNSRLARHAHTHDLDDNGRCRSCGEYVR